MLATINGSPYNGIGMKLEAIIFDFNGVLWWDGHLQDQAWKRFSAEKRGIPFSDAEMANHVHGRSNRYTLGYLLGEPLTGAQLDELSEQKETFYRELCLAEGEDFRLSPGAVDLLDFVVDNQIPRTIATASGKSNVDFFVTHLDLANWFELDRIVYDDGRRPGKPAPDFYLQAAINVNREPERCAVVEDSRSGIAAAYAAGIGAIFALGPKHAHDDLAQLAGVTNVIENLDQFPREPFECVIDLLQ